MNVSFSLKISVPEQINIECYAGDRKLISKYGINRESIRTTAGFHLVQFFKGSEEKRDTNSMACLLFPTS